MKSVARRAKKTRTGILEFPSHDAVPLVQLEREVTVALDPLGVVRVHCRLGRRADGDGLLELGRACAGDPGHLGGEALDVVLFALEHLRGNEHGEVGILDTERLDFAVKPFLKML